MWIVCSDKSLVVEGILQELLDLFQASEVNDPVLVIEMGRFKGELYLESIAVELVTVTCCLPLTKATTQTLSVRVRLRRPEDDSVGHILVPS